jgi:hypothetical protein
VQSGGVPRLRFATERFSAGIAAPKRHCSTCPPQRAPLTQTCFDCAMNPITRSARCRAVIKVRPRRGIGVARLVARHRSSACPNWPTSDSAVSCALTAGRASNGGEVVAGLVVA